MQTALLDTHQLEYTDAGAGDVVLFLPGLGSDASIWDVQVEELSKQYATDRQIVVNSLKKIVTGISDGDSKFNSAIFNGADEREPCYFLVSEIQGNQLRGNTSGLRRRDENGNIGQSGGGNGRGNGGGGCGSFGLLPTQTHH